MKYKLKTIIIIISLLFASQFTIATTCPAINDIKRVEGEYKWTATMPGWSGYFIAPTTGKGRSYTVQKFIAASWVKAHDSQNSTGFIQCDYIGSFGYDGSHTSKDESTIKKYEVIRLIQDSSYSAKQPNTELGWSCIALTKFPNIACDCYSSISNCSFSIG